MNTTITNATNGSIVHITRFQDSQVHRSTANNHLLLTLGVLAAFLILLGLYLIFGKKTPKP